MATRTVPSYVNTRLSKKYKAKCEANQALVDILAEKREKAGSSNFAYSLKRAAESICKEKTAITTYEQAVALKGVGPTIARLVGLTKSVGDNDDARRSKQSDAKKPAAQKSMSRSANSSNPPSPSSITSASLPLPAPKRGKQSALVQTGLGLGIIKECPTRKELAYQKAVAESHTWKGRGLKWKLVLLIDKRERKAEHYASKVEQCGIPTEIRSLPIGDMCWIAQGSEEDDKGNGKIVAELMLGTIIERKEVKDLKSSLFGTRYTEQQLRLKDSGQPQVIFLVEGDTKKDLYKCPAETLHSTMWAIRIEKQNQVIQTAHTEETVQTLRRMHRRMLQRTFPTAFYSEALPSFSGPDVAGRRGRQRDSFGEQRRKRRRRLESLHGLIFDEDPVPMAGMERFVTYKELCARIERDREAGRRTVGSIHQAMLKQVATISDTKIIPISTEYPTANSLLRAYHETSSHSERKRLLEGLDLSSSNMSPGKKSLGPRSAAELYIAYGLDESRRESIESTSSGASYVSRVAKLRAQTSARSDNPGVQKVLAESNDVNNGNFLSTSTNPRHEMCSSATDGVDGTNASTKSRPVLAPAVSDLVDLLSSDDEVDNDHHVPPPPPAKRRRSSLSSSSLASSNGSYPSPNKIKVIGEANGSRHVAASSSMRSPQAMDSSDDEELDALLNGHSLRKGCSGGIAAREVIEID